MRNDPLLQFILQGGYLSAGFLDALPIDRVLAQKIDQDVPLDSIPDSQEDNCV